MKVVLHCLMLLLVHDDVFPQDVRNKASYAIIGINIFIFFLLFIRQAYLIVYKIVQACKHKDKSNTGNDDEDVYARGHGADRNHIETPGREGAAGRYERLESQGHDDRRHSGPHGRPQGNLQQQKYAASTYEADRRGISSGQPQQRPQVGWSDQSGPHGGWNGQPQPINAPTSPTGGMVGGMYSRTSRLKRNDPSTIGITSTAAAVGTDVVAGPTDVREEPPAKAKPQPTWRRNIERRAQEAAAAAAVVAAVDQQRSDQDSASRVGSIDTTSSYDLETGTITQAPVGMHTTQRTSNTSSNDWFQQRLSSNDSEVTQTFTSSALEYRDSDTTDESFITTTPDAPVGPGLTAYGGKKPSIIPLLQTGSFSSSLQREHSPFQGPMINGMDTGELDRVAVGYFQQEAARTNSDTSSGTVKSAMQEDVDIDAMDSDSERGSTRRRSSALDIDQDSEEEGSMGTDDEEETFTSSLLPDRDARVGENDSFVSAMSYEDRR